MVFSTECSAGGHLGPWRRRVFFRSSICFGSRDLRMRAVRALRGLLWEESEKGRGGMVRMGWRLGLGEGWRRRRVGLHFTQHLALLSSSGQCGGL